MEIIMKLMKGIKLFSAALAIAGLTIGTAGADKADTDISIDFDPPSPVADGTLVDITGTVRCNEVHGAFCDAVGKPVIEGSIRLQQVQDDIGDPLACDDLGNGVDFEKIDQGNPNGSGQFTHQFDTTGLGGQTIGFRIQYVNAGGGHSPGNGFSVCADLEITLATMADPLPDGTTSFTQGYYGSAPAGEAIVALLIDEATCEDIMDALTHPISDSQGPGIIDCTSESGRNDLADFLIGAVGTMGGNNDGGFLPSGFNQYNLTAQTITLLLNLNLGVVLTGEDIPILAGYFINIDPVVDLVDGIPGDTIDPVFINAGDLADFCEDLDTNQVCDPGTLVLSALGAKVAALDDAGTTVQEILDASLTLMMGGANPQTVNGVDLYAGDLTNIIGLINESYDEGTPTAFVTEFDAD
jgi:hypothetical protein